MVKSFQGRSDTFVISPKMVYQRILIQESEWECVDKGIETSNFTNKFKVLTEKSFDSEPSAGALESNTTKNHLGADNEGVTTTLKRLDHVEELHPETVRKPDEDLLDESWKGF